MAEYKHKSTPFNHQAEEFEATRDLPAWARLWEQGTGKTKPTIDEIAYLWQAKKINAVIVVAPSGVHSNWISDEVPVHLPDAVVKESSFFIWRSHKASAQYFKKAANALLRYDGLSWLCITYDAFMTKAGKDFLKLMLGNRRAFYVLDESIAIKTPGIKLTKSVVLSGKYAAYRRILNGTPIANAPFDLYTQLKFIDSDFWKSIGADDFGAFKTLFGVWKVGKQNYTDSKTGEARIREYPILIEYKNLWLLSDKLKEVSSRVLKSDVLDLPKKLYTKRYFEMTPLQRKIYNDLKNDYMSDLGNGRLVTAELAIVRMLRFSQITSGYVPTPENEEEPIYTIPGGNPRIELMEELRDETPGQAIIWARFDKDIDQLVDLLGNQNVARYDGHVNDTQREINKKAFKAGDRQWFVSKTRVGRAGITLNEASTTIYYNNTFSLIDRLQSEDRNHRIGQKKSVLYIDLAAENSIDAHIIKALRTKLDVSSQVTGDKLREWI